MMIITNAVAAATTTKESMIPWVVDAARTTPFITVAPRVRAFEGSPARAVTLAYV
jgi:hypothetical protein